MKKSVVESKPLKPKTKLRSSDLQLYSLCLIPVLLVFVCCYLPMVGIIIAFKNYNFGLGIFDSPWNGIENFKFFFASNQFSQLIRNTIGNNFLFIVFGSLAAIFTGILLFEIKSRNATKVFQTILITPHFMSWVVVSYMVYAILNFEHGYLNQLIGFFGIDKVDWYSRPWAWPAILTIATIWKGVGMDSVVYYASLMGIDTSLIEAAEVDGANRLQRTIHIILPSLIPLIAILTILKIGNIFRADFGLFYTVTRDGASGTLYETTNVLDTYIFRMFKETRPGENSYGISAAMGLIQSIVGMVLVILTNAAARKIDPDLGLF